MALYRKINELKLPKRIAPLLEHLDPTMEPHKFIHLQLWALNQYPRYREYLDSL